MYLKLQEKRIYAVLDVYEEEPLPVQNKLRELTNVTLYPHIAGPTFDMRERVVLELLQDVLRYENKQPCKNSIDYEYAIRMTQ
jgi:D-3-phosphoglycerate dehydrogenase/(S)-sulfolactate dehydrogenase